MNNDNGDSSEYIPREGQQEIARPDEVLPDTLQLIPLGDRPYFPVLVQPVVVDLEPWGGGIQSVAETAHQLLALSYSPSAKEKMTFLNSSQNLIFWKDIAYNYECLSHLHRDECVKQMA